MQVGGGAIVAVINPEHRNISLRLHGEVQNGGFVGAEIRRDDSAAAGLGDGPTHDLQRRLRPQLGIPLAEGFGGK